MIRNKAFLTGLGAGMMAGAVLLQLMVAVNKLESKPFAQEAKPLSLDQLKEQADKYNHKLVPKDQSFYTSQEIEDIKKKAAEEERNKTAGQNSSAPVEPPKEKVTRTVWIPEHMDATSVANMLVQAHVIAEPTKLIAALKQMQLSGKIRSGIYTFEDSPDETELVKRLTSPQ